MLKAFVARNGENRRSKGENPYRLIFDTRGLEWIRKWDEWNPSRLYNAAPDDTTEQALTGPIPPAALAEVEISIKVIRIVEQHGKEGTG